MADGKLYEPRGVPLGKPCGCVCPACNEILYSKHCLGEKVVPHFAHAPGSDCANGYETALHLAAKQLIEEHRSLIFPSLAAKVEVRDAIGILHTPLRIVVPAGVRVLESVILEKAIGDIRPDLIVDALGLGKVLVEIAVTHFIDSEKLAKIKKCQIPVLEIDVSGLRLATFDELRKVLFDDPKNSAWVFHHQVATAEDELRLSLVSALAEADEIAKQQKELAKVSQRQYEKRMALAAQERQAQEKAARQVKHEELKRATAFKNRSEPEKVQILTRRLGVCCLPIAIKLKVRGAGSFGVTDPHVWQSTLFGGLIHHQAGNGHAWVKKEFAVDWLRYRFEVTLEFPESEQIAVWDYLAGLANRGALIRRKNGYFNIAVASLPAFESLAQLQAGHVSLESGLTWVAEASWPTSVASRTLARVHSDTQHFGEGWERLSGLLPSARGRTPGEICSKYARFGISEEVIAKYLVSGGFLISLAPK